MSCRFVLCLIDKLLDHGKSMSHVSTDDMLSLMMLRRFKASKCELISTGSWLRLQCTPELEDELTQAFLTKINVTVVCNLGFFSVECNTLDMTSQVCDRVPAIAASLVLDSATFSDVSKDDEVLLQSDMVLLASQVVVLLWRMPFQLRGCSI
ncbi:unnamed protein product [Effrenium voratum]|uniref:Uncharacterized protein n=1 Tax=Effrenium voratum TaxID=2562239 RepID=A0AA36NBT7_9DINO|nr:unnamed protein product [Effrenium voratum]